MTSRALTLTTRILKGMFQVGTASNGAAALRQFTDLGPCAIVLSDMDRFGLSGLELLREMKSSWPDTVRIMIPGNSDQATPVDAAKQGQPPPFTRR
ncbi:hypothetical protein LBMAG56_30320 [Verrucomicrobiota bacterium]|nr:hypothetical protein LBMAG56_30320 [Verrucomicrobiota bacterium]